jgi:hypothetical protein
VVRLLRPGSLARVDPILERPATWKALALARADRGGARAATPPAPPVDDSTVDRADAASDGRSRGGRRRPAADAQSCCGGGPLAGLSRSTASLAFGD